MQGKNVLYYNTQLDLRTPAGLRQLIAQIDSIIQELLSNAPAIIANIGIAEYDLDTGQTKTRVRYNSIAQLKGIDFLWTKLFSAVGISCPNNSKPSATDC